MWFELRMQLLGAAYWADLVDEAVLHGLFTRSYHHLLPPSAPFPLAC